MNRKFTLLLYGIAMLMPHHIIADDEAKDGGYLFVYFEGSGDESRQEQLRFATSNDGFSWKALNDNQPIVDAKSFAESGAIRDPHILRKADGKGFLMVATDMYAIRDGWKYNPGIVMMKSKNLTNWKETAINIGRLYPEQFKDAKWVWAPQTIYDEKSGKYIVYFSVHFQDDSSAFYYAYANKDFTGFEAAPKVFFKPNRLGIDADIIYKDGTYHLFYKTSTTDANGKENHSGIQQAVSENILGPYRELGEYCDPYAGRPQVEGSCVYKTIADDGKPLYVLMYDIFGGKRYEYVTSTDLYTFTKKGQRFQKDFVPRHGTVMSITNKEMKRLQKKFK